MEGFRILGNEDILYHNLVAIVLHKLALEGKIQFFIGVAPKIGKLILLLKNKHQYHSLFKLRIK